MSTQPNLSANIGYLDLPQNHPTSESQQMGYLIGLKPCHMDSEGLKGSQPSVFAPPFVQQGINSLAPTPCFPNLPGESSFSDFAAPREFEYEMTRPTNIEEPTKIGGILINPADMLPSAQQSSVGGAEQFFQLHTTGTSSFTETRPQAEISYAPQREFSYEMERDTRPEPIKYGKTFESQRSNEQEREPTKIGGILINPADMTPSSLSGSQGASFGSDQYRQLYSRDTMSTPHHEPSNVATKLPGGFMEREFSYELDRSSERETPKGSDKKSGRWSSRQFSYGFPDDSEKIRSSRDLGSMSTRSSHDARSPKKRSRGFNYEFVRTPQSEEQVKPGGIIINPEDAIPSRRGELHEDPSHRYTYALLTKGHGTDRAPESENYLSSRVLGMENRSQQEEPRKAGGILINPQDALPSRAGNIHMGGQGSDSYYYTQLSNTGIEPKTQPTEIPRTSGHREDILDLDKSDFLSNFQRISTEHKIPSEPNSGTKVKPSPFIGNPHVTERLTENSNPFAAKKSKPHQFKTEPFLGVKNVVSEDAPIIQKRFSKENAASQFVSKHETGLKQGFDSLYSRPYDMDTNKLSQSMAPSHGALGTRSSLNEMNSQLDNILNRSRGVMSYSTIGGSQGYLGEKSGAYAGSLSNLDYNDAPAMSNSMVFERRTGLYEDMGLTGGYRYNF